MDEIVCLDGSVGSVGSVYSPNFETGTGESSTEYVSEGSDLSLTRQHIEAEADRQTLHQQYQLIRRLTDENRLLRQADLENEEDCSDLRLRLASAERRLVDFENLRQLRKAMEDDNDTLQVTLAQEKGRCTTLEARVCSLEGEKSKLLSRLGAAEEEEHSLRRRLEATQDDYNAALQLCSGKDDSYMTDVKEMLAQAAERSSALEQQLAQLMNTCNELRTEKSQLECEVLELRSKQNGCFSADDSGSIIKPYLNMSDVGQPMSQSTPARNLHRELMQCGEANKSMQPLVERCALSPCPSDASILDGETTGMGGDVLDALTSFCEHFEAKIKLASRHVSDLSDMSELDSNAETGDSEQPRVMSLFEEKLKRLVESRTHALKRASSYRQKLKDARAELATSLEYRDKSDKLAAEMASECESLREKLAAAEASRQKMIGEIQQRRRPSVNSKADKSRSKASSSSSLTLLDQHEDEHSPAKDRNRSSPSPIRHSPSPVCSSHDSRAESPTGLVRKRFPQFTTPVDEPDAANGEQLAPAGFISVKHIELPRRSSWLRLACRSLLYVVLFAIVTMAVVFVICPSLQSSSRSACCSCPPPWIMDLLGNHLVASPAKVTPH